MEADIPDKLFYRIGEVSRLTSLRPSILRYWETEFSELQPQKSSKGQRLYSRKEVDIVLDIKRLLYSEKLTIKGARRVLGRKGKGSRGGNGEGPPDRTLSDLIVEVRNDLLKIRDSL